MSLKWFIRYIFNYFLLFFLDKRLCSYSDNRFFKMCFNPEYTTTQVNVDYLMSHCQLSRQ